MTQSNERVGMPENADGAGSLIDPGVAHDLSNALAAALASARLVRKKTEHDETRELAEITVRQIEKATRLIHEAANR